jgi:hypothetical protein
MIPTSTTSWNWEEKKNIAWIYNENFLIYAASNQETN